MDELNEKLELVQEKAAALEGDVKVGEVYYLPVRVTSRNDNMDRVFFAVEPVGMEVPELVLSPDRTRLLYVKPELLTAGLKSRAASKKG